jgi:predicted TPR repeat methyltransferase
VPSVYQFKDFAGSSHRILIDLIRRYSRTSGVLVDLGAAGGELGQSVRPLFRRTFGFEFDAERIPQLRAHFDAAAVADLERTSRLPQGASAIVMADVLEHLRSPTEILLLVRSSLDSDGVLYLSVPNIANITTRIGLLFGIFRYRERGILDSTHLRFYTLRTIREEVRKAGFSIVATRGSAIPLRLIVGSWVPDPPLRFLEEILARVTQAWKALLAYQIILVAKPLRAAAPPRPPVP